MYFSKIISAGISLVASKFSIFFLHLILARKLPPEEYGIISLVLVVTTILSFLCNAGLATAAIRFIAEHQQKNDKKELNQIISFCFSLSLFLSIVVSIIVYMFSFFVDWLSYVSVLLVPFTIATVLAGILRGFQKHFIAAMPKDIIYPILSCLFFLVVTSLSVANSFAILFSSLLITELIFIAALKKYSGFTLTKYSFNQAINWLKISIPMSFSSIIREGMNRWELLVLSIFVPFSNIAGYSVAIQISLATTIALKTLNFAFSPIFAKQNKTPELKKTLKTSVYLSILAALVIYPIIIIFGTEILSIYGKEYVQYKNILLILLVGQIFNTVTGPTGNFLLMTGGQKTHFKIICVGSILSLLVSILLVMKFKIIGAAIANATGIIIINSLFLLSILCKRRNSKDICQ